MAAPANNGRGLAIEEDKEREVLAALETLVTRIRQAVESGRRTGRLRRASSEFLGTRVEELKWKQDGHPQVRLRHERRTRMTCDDAVRRIVGEVLEGSEF
jgi:hypothetical protein